MPIRLLGAGLVALCMLAMQRLAALVHLPPRHDPSAAELGLSLAAALAGIAGAALLLVGPPLFRAFTWPPRERD